MTETVELEVIKNSFTTDEEHREICSPIVFTHSLQLLKGSLDLETHFEISQEEDSVAILSVPSKAAYTRFFMLTTG